MGCWYETCGLSGLPIPPKTPCLLFLLAPGNHLDDGRAGYSYPSGIWQPRCLPVTGVYNDDRGTLDLTEKAPAHWAYSERILAEDHLAWSESGAPEKLRTEVAPAYTAAFFDEVERGRVFGRNMAFGYRHRDTDLHYPLGQMLVRMDVWEHLLATAYAVGWHDTSREANRQAAEQLVDRILAVPENLQGHELWMAFIAIEEGFRDRKEYSTPFHWLVFDHGGGELPGGCGIYRTALTIALTDKKIDRETALEIFYDLADLAHVGRLMALLRRAWRPQPGKGSQNIEWDLHLGFALEVARIAAEGTRDEDRALDEVLEAPEAGR